MDNQGNSQPQETLDSLKNGAPMNSGGNSNKAKSIVKKVATIIGSIFIGLFILGLIFTLLAKPVELSGSKQFQNNSDDPGFELTLPEQFSEQDTGSSNVGTVYAYTTEKDSEDKSQALAGVVLEDLGVLAPLFEGVLDEGATLEDYLFDLYLNDESGKVALESIIDLTLDLDEVSINEIRERSAANVDRMLEFEFTAENDSGDTGVKGIYWFTMGNDDATGYNLVVAASEDAWDKNETEILKIIDNFNPAD